RSIVERAARSVNRVPEHLSMFTSKWHTTVLAPLISRSISFGKGKRGPRLRGVGAILVGEVPWQASDPTVAGRAPPSALAKLEWRRRRCCGQKRNCASE